MKHFKTGLQLDLLGEYNSAIQAYEQEVKTNCRDINSYINLTFLYWHSIAQFSWADMYNIPNHTRDKSFDRYQELIAMMKFKFPEYGEIYFWEIYFSHRLIFVPLGEGEILNILSNYKDLTVVPYFFLYLLDNEKYRDQQEKLLKECTILPTAKNIYIKSIIET
jgi:hypothetical protein